MNVNAGGLTNFGTIFGFVQSASLPIEEHPFFIDAVFKKMVYTHFTTIVGSMSHLSNLTPSK
jgi:hypothetical protein